MKGFLEVGTDGDGYVMLRHPQMDVDEDGRGWIAFSPTQARCLAALLLKHADVCDGADHDLTANRLIVDWPDVPE